MHTTHGGKRRWHGFLTLTWLTGVRRATVFNNKMIGLCRGGDDEVGRLVLQLFVAGESRAGHKIGIIQERKYGACSFLTGPIF